MTGGMDLIQGLIYNVRGLWFGVKHFKLLFLGFSRFTFAVLITILMVALVLTYDQAITEFVWAKPESRWILWLWHLFSWFVSLFLVALSALLAYLVAQVLFSVLIMDLMSRITEREVIGSNRRYQDPLFPCLSLSSFSFWVGLSRWGPSSSSSLLALP
jgi:CysZ protein